MNAWILVIFWAISGRPHFHHIPGFNSAVACQMAGKDIIQLGIPSNVRLICVRTGR